MTTFVRACLGAFCLLVLGQVNATAASVKAANPAQSGDIKGVINYCRPDRVNGTLVHIPGRIFQAKLGPSGEFVLNYVPPGSYSLMVEIPGSPANTRSGITVRNTEITDVGSIAICNDSDNDGFAEDVDCDDNNPAIRPGVFEGSSGGGYVGCDGVDNNCNGQVDEGCPNCTDGDQDGFCAQQACSGLISGSVTCQVGVDCRDDDATFSPAQSEVCDGADNNCNGQNDDGFDLSNDISNCGVCGNNCDSLPGGGVGNGTFYACESSACVITGCGLSAGGEVADCNNNPSDGCETPLHTDDNCGACGDVCGPGGPEAIFCLGGACSN